MAVAGMPANPDEARQVGRHIADRTITVSGRDSSQACRDSAFVRHACLISCSFSQKRVLTQQTPEFTQDFD